MVECVRVQRSKGEETRQALLSAGVLDTSYGIESTEEYVYLPVTDDPPLEDVVVVDRALETVEERPPLDTLLDSQPTYEQVGDIIVLDEPTDRASDIADAIMRSSLNAKTVVNVTSDVSGAERTRSMSVLAGNGTETVYTEYGIDFELDVREVYFTPRLSTERQRVLDTVESGETVVDMFAGVGPYVIPAAARGATAVGVDINEKAIEYLRRNASRNGVADSVTAHHNDIRDTASQYSDEADHVIMNLPHSADDFAETAVTLGTTGTTIHYYDFQPTESPYSNGIEAFERATETSPHEVSVVEKREVRPYAPGIVNSYLCVELQ